MVTRTVCQECACMPKLPEHERGIPVVLYEYEELMRVKFPKETVNITKFEVDGDYHASENPIKSSAELEDFFRSVLGSTATVVYSGGKIKISTDKVLKTFEYEVNGDANHAIFNKKDERTVEIGANNVYLFETTHDGVGRWVKYVAPTYNASEIFYEGSETNVQDAIDVTKDIANTAKITAEKAQKDVDALDAKITENTNAINELKAKPVEASLYEEGTDMGIKIGETKLKTGHNETVTLTANIPHTITHNLNTKNVTIDVSDAGTGAEIVLSETSRELNTVTITSTEDITAEVIIKR